MKASVVSPGTMMMQCAFSSRSCGIPLSGAAMISEKTDAASPSRLAGSLSIASNDVVKTKPAAITSFIFLPPLSHEVVATALPVHGSHHFRPLAATVQAKGKGSVLAPARERIACRKMQVLSPRVQELPCGIPPNYALGLGRQEESVWHSIHATRNIACCSEPSNCLSVRCGPPTATILPDGGDLRHTKRSQQVQRC